MPRLHHGQLRKAIESDIQLQCVKKLAVIIKPLLLGEPFRIEDAFPVLVVKTRAADVPVYHEGLTMWMWEGLKGCLSIWIKGDNC
jgi:hypothetical protein